MYMYGNSGSHTSGFCCCSMNALYVVTTSINTFDSVCVCVNPIDNVQCVVTCAYIMTLCTIVYSHLERGRCTTCLQIYEDSYILSLLLCTLTHSWWAGLVPKTRTSNHLGGSGDILLQENSLRSRECFRGHLMVAFRVLFIVYCLMKSMHLCHIKL